MPTYYLITHPQTVVSVVKTGKLPAKLPNWFKVDGLFCAKSITDCFTSDTISLDQIFILKLILHKQNNNTVNLKSIEPDSIQEILVYSQQGCNLLNRLFGNACPKLIAISPGVYPQGLNQGVKRPASVSLQESQTAKAPEKKIRTRPPASSNNNNSSEEAPSEMNQPARVISMARQPQNPTGFFQGILQAATAFARSLFIELPVTTNNTFATQMTNAKRAEASLNLTMGRLTTYAEHIQLLQSALREAKKTILITSFDINHETLQKANLYHLMSTASARGVSIYIYYNDQKPVNNNIVEFFKLNNVAYAETFTHSKILAVDKRLVAAGSFNWLSGIDTRYQESEEGSFYLRDEKVCEVLIQDIWNHIKYYRNRQFGNLRRVRRFDQNHDNHCSPAYDLGNKTELTYLPSLHEHCGFFQSVFEHARQRIIVCSPFISTARQYLADIDSRVLQAAISRGVEIYFICSSESPSLNDFNNYLNELRSTKIHLISMSNIHLKTIIVDENIITEGSFNWLSASRSMSSDYHNHEQTLVIKGDMTQKLIDHFFQTRVGETILKHMCNQIDQSSSTSSHSFHSFN